MCGRVLTNYKPIYLSTYVSYDYARKTILTRCRYNIYCINLHKDGVKEVLRKFNQCI